MTWSYEANVLESMKGGFGGFVVRHETGQLGYFKIRCFKFDVVCSRLAKLVGIPVPETEFAQVTRDEFNKQGIWGPVLRNGAVSHFWGDESLDVLAYQKRHKVLPTGLDQMSGIMAFAWWVGYGDLRNEHILWAPEKGFAFIDFDTAFSWRYEKLRHLVGPQILLQNFNPESLKATVTRIQQITHDQIYEAFTSMAPAFYRFRKDEEIRFSKRLFETAQNLPQTIGRYWEKPVIDRTLFPQLSAQDREIWHKMPRQQQIEDCPHQYSSQRGLWQCDHCKWYWPLQGSPEP